MKAKKIKKIKINNNIQDINPNKKYFYANIEFNDIFEIERMIYELELLRLDYVLNDNNVNIDNILKMEDKEANYFINRLIGRTQENTKDKYRNYKTLIEALRETKENNILKGRD